MATEPDTISDTWDVALEMLQRRPLCIKDVRVSADHGALFFSRGTGAVPVYLERRGDGSHPPTLHFGRAFGEQRAFPPHLRSTGCDNAAVFELVQYLHQQIYNPAPQAARGR